jgi:hypothetical protein
LYSRQYQKLIEKLLRRQKRVIPPVIMFSPLRYFILAAPNAGDDVGQLRGPQTSSRAALGMRV